MNIFFYLHINITGDFSFSFKCFDCQYYKPGIILPERSLHNPLSQQRERHYFPGNSDYDCCT